MTESLLVMVGAMAIAGLAGSLHCVGMCGPILLAFQAAFSPAGDGDGKARPSAWSEFLAYHLGRVWTYALLGLLVGLLGGSARSLFDQLGWQRALALAFAAAWIAAGVALFSQGLGLFGARRGQKGQNRRWSPWRWQWFRALVAERGFAARLVLGAVMGLLPCGLVYAALALAATLPSPLHAAVAMLAFGAGTVPALTAVLLASRALPTVARQQGTRLVAASLILAGCVMAWRALMVSAHL